jgi:hypothetical protein
MESIFMAHTLTIKAFFFNAKTDYLPYYKNFTITQNSSDTAEDLLASIHAINSDFNYPKQKLIMQINGLIVEGSASIASLVETFGTTLSINPANSYRSNHGLEINDDDFMQSFTLLEAYASKEDLSYYQSLYALHYASETEKLAHDYIGDAILVLAHKMISEGNTHKEAILEALTSADTGLLSCEYENNLFQGQSYAQEIEALKAMLDEEEEEYPSLMDMIKERFCKEKKVVEVPKIIRMSKVIKELSEKTIAYHAGLEKTQDKIISTMIKDMGASERFITRVNKGLGKSILESDRDLALKKAGTTLLEAYDIGAEVLVIEDEESYLICEKHFKSIENIMGRKMIALELLFVEDFISQVSSVEA